MRKVHKIVGKEVRKIIHVIHEFITTHSYKGIIKVPIKSFKYMPRNATVIYIRP